MSRRAWVSVSADYLVERLGFPKGTRLVCADMNSMNFSLRLGLEGEAMPEVQEGVVVSEITAIMRQEQNEGVRRIYLSLSHAPEKEWLVDERVSPPAPIKGDGTLESTSDALS